MTNHVITGLLNVIWKLLLFRLNQSSNLSKVIMLLEVNSINHVDRRKTPNYIRLYSTLLKVYNGPASMQPHQRILSLSSIAQISNTYRVVSDIFKVVTRVGTERR